MKTRRILSLVLCLLLVLSAFDALAARDYYDKPGCTGAKTTGTHHYVIARDSIEPTCTKAGKAIYRCVYCGKEESETVPALGHDWSEWDPYAPATCTQAAPAQRYCNRCEAEERGTVGRPLGHDWDDWSTKQKATCTEEGLRWTDCNRCGWEKTEPIPALGHDWGEWYITIPATELTEGWYRRDCKRGDIYQLSPYKLNGQPGDDIIEVDSKSAGVMLWLSAVDGPFDTQNMTVSIGWVLTNIGNKDAKDYRVDVYDYANGVKGDVLSSARVFYELNAGKTAKDVLIANYTEEEFNQGYKEVLVTAWATSDERTVYSNEVPLTIYFGDPPTWMEGPALSVTGTWGMDGENHIIDAAVYNIGNCDIVDWTLYIYHIEPDGDGADPYEHIGEQPLAAFGGMEGYLQQVEPTEYELNTQGYMEYGVFAIGFTTEGEYVESNDVTVRIPLGDVNDETPLKLEAWQDWYDSANQEMCIGVKFINVTDSPITIASLMLVDENDADRYTPAFAFGDIVVPANDYVVYSDVIEDIYIPAKPEEITKGVAEFWVSCNGYPVDDYGLFSNIVFSNTDYVEYLITGDEEETPILQITGCVDQYDSVNEIFYIGFEITNTSDEPVTLFKLYADDIDNSRAIVDYSDKGIEIAPHGSVDTYFYDALEHVAIPATAAELDKLSAEIYIYCYGMSETADIIDSNIDEVFVDLSQQTSLVIDAWPLYYDAANQEMHFACDIMNMGDVELVLDGLYVFDLKGDLREYGYLNEEDIILGPSYHIADVSVYALEYELDDGYSDLVFSVDAFTHDTNCDYVPSNTDNVHMDFVGSGETDEEPEFKLSLTENGVVGSCLYIDGYVINESDDVTLYNWGINVYNENTTLNINWLAVDPSLTIYPTAAYSTDFAFGTVMYALADSADLALGVKTLTAVAYAYTEDNEIVYSNQVELEYHFDTDPGEPFDEPDPEYNLKLEVSKTNEKPLYGEETVEYNYTITNNSTDELTDISLQVWYDDSFMGWAIPNYVINYLGAGESYSGKSTLELAFEYADANGLEHVRIYATGYDTTFMEMPHNSNEARLEYQLDEFIWTPPEVESAELEIAKRVANFSKNGQYFQEGETVIYEIYVHNISSVTAYDVEVFDLLKGSNEDAKVGYLTELAPDGEDYFYYEHVVTKEEAEKGWISNTAVCVWYDPGTERQKDAEGSVRTKTGVLIPEDVTVYKEVVNIPAKIYYFEPYETIHYRVTVYNNNSWDISNVWIDDTLVGFVYTGYGTIPAGYSLTVDYYYDPTYFDADSMGYVTNVATCYYQAGVRTTDVPGDVRGYDQAYYCVNSNEVTVPVSYIRGGAHLSTWMYETSTPPHDGYYWLDEVIDYAIVVYNDGTEDLYNVNVKAMRTLDDEPLEIGVIPYLPSGGYDFMYTHTRVDSWDTDIVGYVLNFSIADTYTEDASFLMALSPDVISPVEGSGPVPHDPTDREGKDDYCKLTLKSVQDGAESYEQYYCADHYNAVAEYYTAVKNAKTAADKLAAWENVRAAWTAEIDEMYGEWIKLAEPQKISTIVSERMLFYAYLNSLEQLLSAQYADAPETALEKLCTILADKCSEMCFELNAPEGDRPDSYFSGYSIRNEAVSAEACSDLPGGVIARQVRFTLNFCADHAAIAKTAREAALQLATEADRTASFSAAQRKWISALNSCVNEEYTAADEATRELISAYRTNYGNYLNARKAMLEMVYASAPATAAEAAMREIMFVAAENCD